MEHSDFDDLMKQKLDDLKGPSFKQSALDKFHTLMGSYHPTPWYQRYHTELFVSTSLIVFSLLNIYWSRLEYKRKEEVSVPEVIIDYRIADSLKTIIAQLRNRGQDTLYIVDHRNEESRQAENYKLEIVKQSDYPNRTDSVKKADLKLFLGLVSGMPENVFQRLQAEHMIVVEKGEAYLILSDSLKRHHTYTMLTDSREVPIEKMLTMRLPEYLIKIDPVIATVPERNKTSLKSQDALEKHYFKGMGINIAPHIDLVAEAFSEGSGGFNPRLGITADWILSPRLSIETGLDFLKTSFTIQKDFQNLNLPSLSNPVGAIRSAKVSSSNLSVPLSIKYRQWVSERNQMVLKAGYTPYFSLQTQYLYNYSLAGLPAEPDLTFSTLDQVDQFQFYGGTMTLSAGIMRSLNKKRKFEASLFYEKSLGGVGAENLDLQLFGIRTALWFNLK